MNCCLSDRSISVSTATGVPLEEVDPGQAEQPVQRSEFRSSPLRGNSRWALVLYTGPRRGTNRLRLRCRSYLQRLVSAAPHSSDAKNPGAISNR